MQYILGVGKLPSLEQTALDAPEGYIPLYLSLFSIDIIEHLAKDGEKSMFWIINEEVRESLLNLKNTMYHSRWIRYFPRLRQDQDHCLTLKNTPYPHQQIHCIRYFGQHSKETRFPSNTPYPEKLIRRIQWRLMNILE
ncbi:hypothetical protein Tco_1226819 [Tanacetum coccineum]